MTAKQNEFYVGGMTAAGTAASQDVRADNGFGYMAGFLVVAILPAAFWTAILNVGAGFFGIALSTMFLGCFFTTIAAFLGVIFAAVARRT